jgi:hypothetical protein
MWAILVVPFVIALAALAHPHWFPVLDLAQTELRVRDVFSSHPPLVGLPGRIGTLSRPGSHPGPVSFWAMWPFYVAAGSSSWAMEVAGVCLHLIAIAGILWVAKRRGGTLLVLAFGALVAVLLNLYGPELMTQPWNPYLPLMWWVLFLVAAWSVLCDDWAMLPVAVFAGSFSAQTHIPYAAPVAIVGLVAYGGMLYQAMRHRADPAIRSSALRWSLGSAALLVVLWLPPVIQQITGSDGNLALIWHTFTNPDSPPIGVGRGTSLLLVHLNPWRLVFAQDATTGSVLPGLLLLLAWLAAVWLAWRVRHRLLLMLDLVIGVALLVAVENMGQIFGYVWYYLVLWAWALNGLMLLSIGWTIATLLQRRGRLPSVAPRVLAAGLAVVAITFTAVFAVAARDTVQPDTRPTEILAKLAPSTVAAVRAGKLPGTGSNGRYMVTFTDTVDPGSVADGLVLELDRHGFDAGVPERAVILANRSMKPAQATAVVHVATGAANIAHWRAKPGATEIASFEPRSPSQQQEYARLRVTAIRELDRRGLREIAVDLDQHLFAAIYQPATPTSLKPVLERMLALGQPVAVFIGPPQIDPQDN